MRQLTPEGRRIVEDLAQRHRFSAEAVTAMLMAVVAGGGSKAQFDHPEFGGMGQWSQGGMTMIGDMFNNALKARVDGLCAELVGLLARQPLTPQPMGGQARAASPPTAAGERSACSCRSPAVHPVLVAGRPRSAVLHRAAKRHPLCRVSRRPQAGDRHRRQAERLRHPRPPDRRYLAAAERRRVAQLHQPARTGAPQRAARRRR